MVAAPRLLVLHIGALGIGGGIARVAGMCHRAWAGLEGGVPWDVCALSLLGQGREGPPSWAPRLKYRAFEGDRVSFSAAAVLAASEKPDLVVADHANILPVGVVASAIAGAPLASWLYGVEVFPIEGAEGGDGRRSPISWLRRAALRKADLLFAISEFTSRRALEVEPGLSAPVVCLLAPHHMSTTGRKEFAKPIALMVARMSSDERYKGHDEVLLAWARVRREVRGASLRIVGEGDDAHRLESKARSLGFSAAEVSFEGRLDEGNLEAAYASARVFLMPSRGEGFGLVYCEAARFGVASIAHASGPAREIVRDGETGWLVNGARPEAIAEALVNALGDEEEARRRGEAARVFVESTFRPERFARTLRHAIGKLLGLAEFSEVC